MTPAQEKTLAWINALRTGMGVEPIDEFPPNFLVEGESRSLTCPIAVALAPLGVRGFAADRDWANDTARASLNPFAGNVEVPLYVHQAQVEFDRTRAWV